MMDEMERELERTRSHAIDVQAANAALVAEVNMLRAEQDRLTADNARLNGVCATLLGRLLSINDVIAGAVKASIKHGIEASAEHAEQMAVQTKPEAPPVAVSEELATQVRAKAKASVRPPQNVLR